MGYTTSHNGSTGPNKDRTALSILAFGAGKVRLGLSEEPLASPHSLDVALPRLEKSLKEFGLVSGRHFVSYAQDPDGHVINAHPSAPNIFVAVKDVKPAELFKYLATCGFRPSVPNEIGATFLSEEDFARLSTAQRPKTFQEQVPATSAGILFATHNAATR